MIVSQSQVVEKWRPVGLRLVNPFTELFKCLWCEGNGKSGGTRLSCRRIRNTACWVPFMKRHSEVVTLFVNGWEGYFLTPCVPTVSSAARELTWVCDFKPPFEHVLALGVRSTVNRKVATACERRIAVGASISRCFAHRRQRFVQIGAAKKVC